MAERIALRVHRLHADIGRDPGEHLIGAKKQILGTAEQHHLLGRVAAAGEHLESPARRSSMIRRRSGAGTCAAGRRSCANSDGRW